MESLRRRGQDLSYATSRVPPLTITMTPTVIIESLTEAASDWDGVKRALSDRFTETPKPEENIQKAMSCRQDGRNLLASMDEIDKLYKKAGFNDEAKHGLLRNAAMAHLDVAQFAIYRSPAT